MQLISLTPIVPMLCASVALMVGIAGNLHSLSSWTVLMSVSVVAQLGMMWQAKDPRQAMSQCMQEVVR